MFTFTVTITADSEEEFSRILRLLRNDAGRKTTTNVDGVDSYIVSKLDETERYMRQ